MQFVSDNFDARCIIGEGGFGDVYLGTYQDDYKVAIKRLRQNKEEITEEQKKDYTDQFETEVEVLQINVYHFFTFHCVTYKLKPYFYSGKLSWIFT